jgi:hypothetical protein
VNDFLKWINDPETLHNNRNRVVDAVRPEIQHAAWVLDLPKVTAQSRPGRYLAARGLWFDGRYPNDLRIDGNGDMIALLRDREGYVCSYQRTVLKDGPLGYPHKEGTAMMKNPDGYKIPRDAAIRLGTAFRVMGVGEGTETALSALKRFGVTTWALGGSSRMEMWTPPVGIKALHIFKDRTSDKELEKARAIGGISPVDKAAQVLRGRAHKLGIAVTVHEPERGIRLDNGRPISDFNDVLRNEMSMEMQR